MQTKWNIGGCGTDCGSSGVTVDCPCVPPCDAGTTRNAYDVDWRTPGGGPVGNGTFTYESEGTDGVCKYTNGSTYDVCGVTCYGELYINGATALFLLRRVSDDTTVVTYSFTTLLGTADCSQDYALDPGLVPGISCGNVPLTTASVTPNGTAEVDCTETPYVIPPGSGNCCPCEPCGLFYDPINRLDSADPGDLWTEVSGDWYTESAGLRSDDADAIILANSSAPGGVEMRTVIVPVAGNAGEYNLILGYADADNYFRVCWTFGGNLESTAGDTLKLYQMAAGVETELTLTAEIAAQAQYSGGPGWLFIGCINEARTHLTGLVRSTDEVPVLLSSAQISAAAVGDLAGLGQITVASGGYRSPALNTVSADCQTCTAYSRCTHVGTPSPCVGVLLPSELQLTLPGGWTNYSPGGNCACPQYSALSVVVEFGVPGNFGSRNIPAGIQCLYGFTHEVQGSAPDYFGCTTFKVDRLEVFLWWEAVTPTTIRWRAKLILQTTNAAVSDTAEWASDPFAFEAWDCKADWALPKLALANEHPGDPAFLPPHPLCAGAMGTPLLVEVL